MVQTAVLTAVDLPDLEAPRDQRTARKVADLLKSRFRSSISHGNFFQKLRWVTACLTAEPTEDSVLKYADLDEASFFVFVAVNILTPLDGIRGSKLLRSEVFTSPCRLRLATPLLVPHSGPANRPRHPTNIVESLSFSEVR